MQARIRAIAADSRRVFFTDHARKRIKQRHLSLEAVLAVLRLGRLLRAPEHNAAKGSLECRMERFVDGRDLAVIVAISDGDPDLVVITAMTTGN